jgi:hypothetical protein
MNACIWRTPVYLGAVRGEAMKAEYQTNGLFDQSCLSIRLGGSCESVAGILVFRICTSGSRLQASGIQGFRDGQFTCTVRVKRRVLTRICIFTHSTVAPNLTAERKCDTKNMAPTMNCRDDHHDDLPS